MANSIAKLAILLTTDTSGMTRGFAQARSQVNGFSSSIGGSTIAAGSLATALAGVAAWGVRLNDEARMAAINFSTMLGSAQQAQQLVGQLKTYALESPFSQSDLQNNAQTLLAFGVEAEKVDKILRMLGDISLGNADKMNRLTLAFAQTSATGRLMGQDLLQMINAGFNPLQEISRITGISMEELKKKMEEGAITLEWVVLAFEAATQKGSRFYDAINNGNDTISGQWSKLKENIAELIKPLTNRLWYEVKEGLHGWNLLLGDSSKKSKDVANDTNNAANKLKELAKQLKDARPTDEKSFLNDDGMKRFREEAERLTESLRTPQEVFVANAAEYMQMFDRQGITAETYARAMERAKEALRDSSASAEQIKEALTPGTAATSRFSSQGRSDALSYERNFGAMMKQREQEEKERFNQHEETNRLLKEAALQAGRREQFIIEEHSL